MSTDRTDLAAGIMLVIAAAACALAFAVAIVASGGIGAFLGAVL